MRLSDYLLSDYLIPGNLKNIMKLSSILGLNARFQFYSYPYNLRCGKKIAASKLLTKRVLGKAGVQIPHIFARFKNYESITNFDWKSLPSSFALKPSRGLGGQGIIVVKKKSTESTKLSPLWVTTQRKRVSQEDLRLHAEDILDGAYSLGNLPDIAYIEEFVGRHKAFRKYAYRGTPDIRVIVFNSIPVMAMLRLPTRQSGGRANLHQGAIGVGVDIATGITTHAVLNGETIKFKPGTKRKLHGLKIPFWDKILEVAVSCQKASGLGYLGVDIVLHPEKGPLVLELNSEPGLDIQIANNSGLRKRLERVEELKVLDAEHGVKIARALFASSFATRVKAQEGKIKQVSVFEKIKLRDIRNRPHLVDAKIDTGAWRTSIDRSLAQNLGLLNPENIITKKKKVSSAMGEEKRPVIALDFSIAGKKVKTSASVASRKHLRKRIVIGRRDLAGFVVELNQETNSITRGQPLI